MMKSISLKVFLIALLLLTPFLSSPAHAALGDFLYQWGGEKYDFEYPIAVAVDSGGNAYVGSPYDGVYVFDNTGTFIRKFCSYGSGDGQVQYPRGIAVDSNGNVYVADAFNRVQIFSNNGTFIRKWGTAGSGDGQFSNPTGIAVDPNGNVYVADTNNGRVQVFSNTGVFIRKIGMIGTLDGQFVYPFGVALDTNGYVYVTDALNRIQVFNNSGTFIRKWGTSGSGDKQFNNPKGISLDSSGNVYVVDSGNNRVQVFSNDGAFITKWGSQGPGDGQFSGPNGLAMDSGGKVYVADSGNTRVQVFSGTGTFVYKFGSNSGGGLFNSPYGIATDAGGNVYVADTSNNRVQVFTNTGQFLRMWGSGGTGDGQFNAPQGIAVDGDGNVYVTEWLGHRVQVFSNNGTFLRKWGTEGSADGQFRNPWGIAVDRNGSVFVGDSGNYRVQVFSSTGTFLRKWGSLGSSDGQFSPAISGVALDSNGNVYVDDVTNYRVQVFTNEGAFLKKFYPPNTGSLTGIAVDSGGNIYLTDIFAPVTVLSNSGILLGTWSGQLNHPNGIAVDSAGRVFVADSGNNRIQVFKGINYCVITANAGVDQTVEQTSPSGANVTLNGSGTTQQGCIDELTYTWSWLGSSATGTNPTTLLPAGTTTVTLTVTSGAQTATDTVIVTVQDTQKPVTTSIVSGIGGTNGWYVSDVVISLSASDSGSGVKEIHYSIDGTETIVPGGNALFTISTESTHTVTYYAKDNAGNSEAAHLFTINIDKTLPTIAAAQNPPANANGWNNTDVTVSFTCNDAVSGIASCTQPITATTDGRNQSITGTAVDMAGLTSSASVTLNIDKTPPAITITGIVSGQTYTLGSTAPGYSVTDSLSGVATQNATLIGGNANGVGTYTYTVNATDNAGNAASAAAVYTMNYGFSGFLEPISLGKPFKLGSTIPVKFQLTNAQGGYISTAVATISVQLYSGDTGVDNPIILTPNGADSGNVFRYDAVNNQYIYNLGTKGLSEGTWQITATLDDGTVKSTPIKLKKN